MEQQQLTNFKQELKFLRKMYIVGAIKIVKKWLNIYNLDFDEIIKKEEQA